MAERGVSMMCDGPVIAGRGRTGAVWVCRACPARGRGEPPERHRNPLVAPDEDVEQEALAAILDATPLLWCHVPNGGKRGKVTAAKLAAQGVKAGVPDVLVFGGPGFQTYGTCTIDDINGAAIELKRRDVRPATSRAGRFSGAQPHQREWLTALEAQGWLVAVAYGCDHAVEILRGWGYRL